MYGCNKLYCEHLGRYYARFYKQLAAHAAGRVDFRCVRFPGLISAMTLPVRRHLRLRAGDDSRRGARRAVCLLRAPRHADSVHGDARRGRRAAALADGAARAADPHGLQPVRRSAPRAQEIHDVVAAAFPAARRSPGRSTRSGRRSWIRGPRTWTTRRRAATGASRRRTISGRAFAEYLIPTHPGAVPMRRAMSGPCALRDPDGAGIGRPHDPRASPASVRPRRTIR